MVLCGVGWCDGVVCCGGVMVVVCCGGVVWWCGVLWCVVVVCCGGVLWCAVVCCGGVLWCVRLSGHYEFPPFTSDTMRSAYHVRSLQVFKLKQVGVWRAVNL